MQEKYRVKTEDGQEYEVEVGGEQNVFSSFGDNPTEDQKRFEATRQKSGIERFLNTGINRAADMITGIPKVVSGVLKRGKELGEAFPEVRQASPLTPNIAAVLETAGGLIWNPIKQSYESAKRKIQSGNVDALPEELVFGLPLVGPMMREYSEDIKGGKNIEAATKMGIDAAGMLLGAGAGKSGRTLGRAGKEAKLRPHWKDIEGVKPETLATGPFAGIPEELSPYAKTPEPIVPVPGASQFAVEEPGGIIQGMAIGKTGTPTGAKVTSKAVLTRNKAVAAELARRGANIGAEMPDIGGIIQGMAEQGLKLGDLEASRQAAELTRATGGVSQGQAASGEKIAAAMRRRATKTKPGDELIPGTQITMDRRAHPPRIPDSETALYNDLKDNVGETVAPNLEPIQALAEKFANSSQAAKEFLASNLPESVRKIMEKGAKIPSEQSAVEALLGQLPEGTRDLISGMEPTAREHALSLLSAEMSPTTAGTGAMTWNELYEARKAVGDLLNKISKSPMGAPGSHELGMLKDAMDSELRRSIAEIPWKEGPDLTMPGATRQLTRADQFDKAKKLTGVKHKLYGEGQVGNILKFDNPTPPSEIMPKLVSGTPEEARRARMAIGQDPRTIREFRSSALDDLWERSKVRGPSGRMTVDFEKADIILGDAKTGKVYKELLGDKLYRETWNEVQAKLPSNTRMADRSKLVELSKEAPEKIFSKVFKPGNETQIANVYQSLPAQKQKGFQRSAWDGIVKEVTTDQGIVDGVKFKKVWKENRSAMKAAGFSESQLGKFDELADEIGKYYLSHNFNPADPRSKWGTIAETGIATKTGVSAATGNVATAAANMAYLMTPNFVLRAMLHPQGPNVLLRAMRTGKWAEALGKIGKTGMYSVTGASEAGRELKQSKRGNK